MIDWLIKGYLHVHVCQEDAEEDADHEHHSKHLVVRDFVGEYGVESIKVHQSIQHCIYPCHCLKKVSEVIQLPESVDLV